MLNSTKTTEQLAESSRRSPQPVRVNAVVTKGKIAVASRPGLQVVASNEPALAEPVSADSDAAQERFATASWLKEPSDAEASAHRAAMQAEVGSETEVDTQPYSDPQIATGPSMKLIKLMAAAGALAVAAIILAFLQFSGPAEDAAGTEVASAQTSAVLNAASASTLKTTTADSAVADSVSSDLVAQITAGTLAALRTGASNRSTSGGETVARSQGGAVAPTSEQPTALYAMVMQAVQQGQSVQYIDRLVNEAYQANEITVPPVLLTNAGTVDTKTLLTLFVGATN